jgi:acetylxylan esterase
MGSAQSYLGFSRQYLTYADQKGFILIYPQTPNNDRCWDIGTSKSLMHEGGGDTQGLAAMVKYALQKYNGDSAKVFVTGSSSGGFMTNLMCAVYPELFNAGASFSGVAAGCFAGDRGFSPMRSNGSCAGGRIRKSPEQWGKAVRAMYPGYNSRRPRMAIWHGTSDTLVTYANLGEALKEWSNVLGVTFTKNETNNPQARYTKMVYGDGTKLLGYSAAGVGHMVPQHAKEVLQFFGI